MRASRPAVLSVFLVLASAALAAAQTAVAPPPLFDAGSLRIDAYTLQTPVLPAPQRGGPFRVGLTLGGAPVTLELRPKLLRADDFELLVEEPDGKLVRQAPPPPRTYRGAIAELPGSRVAASLLDAGLYATIRTPDARLWIVQPLRELDPAAAPGAHVVFARDEATVIGAYRCGLADAARPVGAGAEGGVAGGGDHIADIAFDTDVEFYQRNGSSVPNTLFDIENVLNNVETIYEADVDITYEITAVIVRTTTDPYESNVAGTLLTLFTSYWNSNYSTIRRDTAHLMTGRTPDGTVVGIANIGEVCNLARAYGLSASRSVAFALRPCLTAHELGHNWDAVHCDGDADCSIMCSSLNGCAANCNAFSPRSAGEIIAFRNSRFCLIDSAPAPLDPPFFDDFPDGLIDPTRWTYVQGASTNNAAVDPPSPPLTLMLNASGPGEFQDDEVRTNFIRLGGATAATVSYATQHRFVESGETLIVEFWAATLRWVELNRIVSDGSNEEVFTTWTHDLPPAALHDEFRLRFRPDVDTTDDRWFVDDVRVATASAATITIASAPAPGVAITVTPPDNNGAADGVTPFTRTYAPGTPVTLTAPLRPVPYTFRRWTIDGAPQPLRVNVLLQPAADRRFLTAEYWLIGDLNGDGLVNNFDVDPFVLALVDPPAYAAQYPALSGAFLGDVNEDGAFDNSDVDAFAALLTR